MTRDEINEEFQAFDKLDPALQAKDVFKRYQKLSRIDQICIMMYLAKQCPNVCNTDLFELFARYTEPLEDANEQK